MAWESFYLHGLPLNPALINTYSIRGTFEVWKWVRSFYPALYWACDLLPILGLTLIHVRNRVSRRIASPGSHQTRYIAVGFKSCVCRERKLQQRIIDSIFSISEICPWESLEICGLNGNKNNHHMMTSSNGNIFRVTDTLCGEFTGHRWIPRTKDSVVELWCFLSSVPEQTV